ncbi:hypothetical protein FQN54_001398 [Arachnomyces sp. PD_36]|nr:hypothetical protein FQN54_001398 [Arachnomyces sp. PD_36]
MLPYKAVTPTSSTAAEPTTMPASMVHPARKLFIFKALGETNANTDLGKNHGFKCINAPGLPITEIPEFTDGWGTETLPKKPLTLPVLLHAELASVADDLNRSGSAGPGWVFVSAGGYPGPSTGGFYAAVFEKSGNDIDSASTSTLVGDVPESVPAEPAWAKSDAGDPWAPWPSDQTRPFCGSDHGTVAETAHHDTASQDSWVTRTSNRADPWGESPSSNNDNVKKSKQDHVCGTWNCSWCQGEETKKAGLDGWAAPQTGGCYCGCCGCWGCDYDGDYCECDGVDLNEKEDDYASKDDGDWGQPFIPKKFNPTVGPYRDSW